MGGLCRSSLCGGFSDGLLVAEPRVVKTLRKFEEAFDLPEGYFLEEQLGRAERELRRLVRQGFVSLADLEGLIARGRRDQESAQTHQR